MVKTKHNTSVKTSQKSNVNGEHLANMLAASSFSEADKARWVTAVPQMSADQLKRFENILRADMEEQAKRGVEDVALSIKAVEHRRDLSLLALDEQMTAELDEIERSLAA